MLLSLSLRDLQSQLTNIEYRMDTLRDTMYRRFMSRESILRRLSQLHNSVKEQSDKVHSALNDVKENDEWHLVQVSP